MNMGSMQQASMRETAIYNWRGLMSTSMRHTVPEMLNSSLKHFPTTLRTCYYIVGEVY